MGSRGPGHVCSPATETSPPVHGGRRGKELEGWQQLLLCAEVPKQCSLSATGIKKSQGIFHSSYRLSPNVLFRALFPIKAWGGCKDNMKARIYFNNGLFWTGTQLERSLIVDSKAVLLSCQQAGGLVCSILCRTCFKIIAFILLFCLISINGQRKKKKCTKKKKKKDKKSQPFSFLCTTGLRRTCLQFWHQYYCPDTEFLWLFLKLFSRAWRPRTTWLWISSAWWEMLPKRLKKIMATGKKPVPASFS